LRQTTMASVGFLGLQMFLATTLQSCGEQPSTKKSLLKVKGKYRKLKKDKDGILNLPKGFSYKIIARMGDPMSDGP